FGQDFDLQEAPATVTHGCPHAVRTGIAAADDDGVFARGRNEVAVSVSVEQALGIGGEELHREMNPFELAAFDGQIPRFGGAGAENNGIEFLEQLAGGEDFADFAIAHKPDTLLLEDMDPAQDDLFFVELHIRNAVHEQAPGTIRAFEDGHGMSGAIELRRGAQAGGSGTDHGDLPASTDLGRLRIDPAFLPAFVDDGAL